MCDEAKLKQWALDRRQFGALAGAAAVAACAPGEVQHTEEVLKTAGRWDSLTEEAVTIETEDGVIDGFFAYPTEAGKRPGVIHWPDIAGVRESHRNMARRLAQHGHAVLLVNPYYRDVAGEQFADFAAFIEAEGFTKVRPWRDKLSSFAVKRDAQAIVGWLDEQAAVDGSRGIGAHGYCMGGPFTVYSAHAMPDRVKAAASFHGGGLVREDDESPHKLLAGTQATYLFAIARDDDAQSPGDKTALKQAADEADRNALVEVYSGDHGWTVPDSPAYDELAAEQAFGDLLQFYQANL